MHFHNRQLTNAEKGANAVDKVKSNGDVHNGVDEIKGDGNCSHYDPGAYAVSQSLSIKKIEINTGSFEDCLVISASRATFSPPPTYQKYNRAGICNRPIIFFYSYTMTQSLHSLVFIKLNETIPNFEN